VITILHLITDLGRGGAQNALSRLVLGMDRAQFRSVVVSLKPGGPWTEVLRQAGVEVRDIGFERANDVFRAHTELQRILRQVEPNIVQSWLYHADLMATLARPHRFGASLGWNLRNSDLSESRRLDWRCLVALLAALSRTPRFVVSNSQSGIEAHLRMGYRPQRIELIPNGIDTQVFRPDLTNRAEARALFGLPQDKFLIGMVARYDDFKDHRTFAQAASLQPGAHFVLAGAGTDSAELKRLVSGFGLAARLSALGDVGQIATLYQAFDIATLTSSHGEGFPNAVAEAMACGLPVVATDVGATRDIVGDAGIVVQRGAPADLAKAWAQLGALAHIDRAEMGRRARERIATRYGLTTVIKAYEALYRAQAQ